MSELILLIACGRRWTERCDRLVRECSLFQICASYNVGKTSLKPSYRMPVASHSISRQLTSWNSLKRLMVPREYNSTSISSGKVRESWRSASIVQACQTSAVSRGEREIERTKNRTAQASLHLQQLLDIDAEKAEFCIKAHQGFTVINPADIPYNYKACRTAGFSKGTIEQSPEILAYPSTILEEKIKFIVRMNLIVIDDAIPFFKLGMNTLRSFSRQVRDETAEHGTNRITYMAEQLQCPVLAVCQVFAKYNFMQMVPFPKLLQVLQIMLDYGVSRKDILNDVWALRYTTEMIKERLKKVTDFGVDPVKPWMIRCTEDALARRIGKELARRSILGEKGTIIEYLSRRLDCDKTTITALVSKIPRIAQVSGPKVKLVIDFLVANGYTVEHMMRVPRIFFHSPKTMQKRLVELQNYGHSPKSLIVFCKSKQQYDNYLNTIKLKELMTNDFPNEPSSLKE